MPRGERALEHNRQMLRSRLYDLRNTLGEWDMSKDWDYGLTDRDYVRLYNIVNLYIDRVELALRERGHRKDA